MDQRTASFTAQRDIGNVGGRRIGPRRPAAGEDDVTAYLGNEPLERYSIFAPNAAMTGDGILS
jgi:hypothetical protein